MHYRANRHGLRFTELGLGTAQFGNLYRETTEDEAAGAFEAAWDAGIRYFDVAPHYGLGLAEERLGRFLRTKPRDEYVISSKVGRLLVPSPATASHEDKEGFAVPASKRRVWDFSRNGILQSIEATLRRMGLERVDIFYLHDPDDHMEQAADEGIHALIELRDQGVVKSVGAGMNDAAPLAALIRAADIDLVMVAGRYTLLEQGASDDLLPLAMERQVGVVVAGVFNSGLLSSPRPASNSMYNYQSASPEVISRAEAIADVCEQWGVTLPDAALAFPLRHPAVVSVVVGCRTAAQVASNLQHHSSVIPPELWSALAAAGLLSEPDPGIPRSTLDRQDLP